MAKRKAEPEAAAMPGRKRTKPTEPPTSGGSYDAETGKCLQEPPEHKAAERDETKED